jgi:hypothetical protein
LGRNKDLVAQLFLQSSICQKGFYECVVTIKLAHYPKGTVTFNLLYTAHTDPHGMSNKLKTINKLKQICNVLEQRQHFIITCIKSHF